MKNELEYKSYGTSQVYFEEGYYTREDLLKIIRAMERQDKQIKELIGVKNDIN